MTQDTANQPAHWRVERYFHAQRPKLAEAIRREISRQAALERSLTNGLAEIDVEPRWTVPVCAERFVLLLFRRHSGWDHTVDIAGMKGALVKGALRIGGTLGSGRYGLKHFGRCHR